MIVDISLSHSLTQPEPYLTRRGAGIGHIPSAHIQAVYMMWLDIARH